MLPFFIALMIFALITKVINVLSPEAWSVPAGISMVIYIFILVGMFVMTFFMMVQRFYKNLLSEEGYLMHTLPVKPWSHIVSKLLVSTLWIITSTITAFISVTIITLNKSDLTNIFRAFTNIHFQLTEELGSTAYILSLEFLLFTLVGLIATILSIYCSIALGQLFNRRKLLASFGAFLLLNTFSQFYFLLIAKLPGINSYFAQFSVHSNNLADMQQVIQSGLIYGIFSVFILCAVFFALTNYILSNRLNLE